MEGFDTPDARLIHHACFLNGVRVGTLSADPDIGMFSSITAGGKNEPPRLRVLD